MEPSALIESLAAQAEIAHTPCGSGQMPWRSWGERGPLLVLIHGGSGSWLHWIRNIESLAQDFRVLVPDLPGLGDADDAPEPADPPTVAAIVADGIRELTAGEPFHLAAFSWGCTVAGGVALSLPEQVRSLFLTGPAALGDVPTGDINPLRRREPNMTAAQLLELQRENLQVLMLHAPTAIDDLALECQVRNASRSRFNSPRFAKTNQLYRWLSSTGAPLSVMYGGEDATARPHFALRCAHLRRIRGDLRFSTATGAGHWLQYERPEAWHGALLRHLRLAGHPAR